MSENNSTHADIVTVAPKPSGFNPTDIYPEDSQRQKKLERQQNECCISCCDGTWEACCEICEDLIQFWCCLRFWNSSVEGGSDSSNCCSCCEGSDGCCEGSDGCCDGSCECCDNCCDGDASCACDSCDGCFE